MHLFFIYYMQKVTIRLSVEKLSIELQK